MSGAILFELIKKCYCSQFDIAKFCEFSKDSMSCIYVICLVYQQDQSYIQILISMAIRKLGSVLVPIYSPTLPLYARHDFWCQDFFGQSKVVIK